MCVYGHNCMGFDDEKKEDIESMILSEPQYFEWNISPKLLICDKSLGSSSMSKYLHYLISMVFITDTKTAFGASA